MIYFRYIAKICKYIITLQILPGSTWDPSSQTHIGPFDPEVQIKSQWIL